jgi:beta-lactamase regulating signal transducer with metallopeptidase domain
MMMALTDWYPGDRALDVFLIVAIGATLLSSAAWLVARRLPRRPAARHLVLASSLICCLLMPALASIFTATGWTLIAIPILPAKADALGVAGVRFDRGPARWRAGDGPHAATAPRPIGSPVDAPVLLTDKGRRGPAPASVELPRAGDPSKLPANDQFAATMVLAAWGIGSALLLLNLARNYWLVRRLRRASSPMTNDSIQRLLADAGRSLGVRRLPALVVSRQAITPFAVGFLRPVVVLPERLIGAVGDDEMRDVLVHEVAHVRRRDGLIVVLQELARALYWPIVPVHGLVRELGQAREELCDNHVLRGRDALSYGETLLRLAELSWEARPLRATAGILHWKGALERRIAGLLDQRRSTMTGNRDRKGVGTIAAATRFIAAAVPDDTSKKVAADAKPKPKPAPNAKRSILIHVVGPDGQPMPGVEVHRSVWTRKPIKSANVHGVSDDRGQFRFDVPETTYIYRIWARAKGHVPLFAGWEKQEDPEQSLPAEFTFRLERGTVIGGIVRNQDGKPIEGVIINVRLDHGGQRAGRAGPDTWLATQYDGVQPITDKQGRWSLDNIPAGDDVKVLLMLNHPDHVSDPEWGTLQKEQGVSMEALRARTATIAMRGGLSATGTVTDPEGKPVAGEVVVRGEHPYWEWGSQEVRTDDRGVYRLPPLPRGPLTITVVAPGWMPLQQKVDLQPGLKPVDFHLEPGKKLRIRFVDRLGGPIPGIHVSIHQWRGGEALYNHRHPNVLNTQIPDLSDDAGRYQWTWAPDDAVTYQFWKEGHATRESALVADGSEQTITIERKLRISGKVMDAVTGRSIEKVTAIPVD